ncbi:MAG: small subunit ribosomal protein S17 [bacterium]|nr:MAG: small subunit ribosomal protein S17 [bacterium]
MIGRVVSTKLAQTATILIERVARHPLYKKTFVRSKKYLVHDPLGVKEGDVVEIIKVRPISKNKHWQITRVIGKSLVEIAEEKLKQAAKETIAEVMPEEKEGP